MRHASKYVIAAGLLWGTNPGLADGPRYLNSRQVAIAFETGASGTVERARLWVSTDEGKSWAQAATTKVGAQSLRYAAPRDGRYALYLVLENAAGRSTEPPRPQVRPHADVVIDTTPPMIQLHEAVAASTDEHGTQLRIRASVIDENFSDGGIRAYYRSKPEGNWRDAGPAQLRENSLHCTLPAGVDPFVDLRIVATDRAGNRGSDQLLGVKTTTSAAPTTQPTSQPSPSAGGDLTVKSVTVAPVAAVEAVRLASQVQAPTTRPADVRALRRIAEEYRQRGQFGLATLRLEQAATAAPENPDVLVELGSAMYREGRYDEAGGRYQAAMLSAPEHLGAIEGLALVAATQRRYPQARGHLQTLLRLSPESGRFWLRYGDVLHKLGRTDEAVDAWDRVLDVRDAVKVDRTKARERLKYFKPPSKARPP